jgi:hypothetical protein
MFVRYIVKVTAPTTCDVCGFVYAKVAPVDVAARLTAATTSLANIVTGSGDVVRTRPSEQRWSILEYACHVRDVLISIRERLILATIVDVPTGVALHRDERVARGFYRNDSVEDVAEEIRMLSRLLLTTYAVLTADDLQRRLIYSHVSPNEVTIMWAAAQAVHEAEHHLGDVEENLTLLS